MINSKKMKCFYFISMFFVSNLFYSQDDLINKLKNNGGNGNNNYKFTNIIDLKSTPVKNQAKSGTCWSYGIVALLENEIIRKGGNEIDLSEMYIVKNTYIEKADRYVKLNGTNAFSQGGANTDLMDIVGKYGIVPQNIYQGLNYGTKLNNHYELEASLKGILDAVISNKGGKLTTAWKRAFVAFLEEYLGKEPQTFEYQNKKYTPKEFTEKIVKFNPKEYIQITSFTNYKMWENCQLDVPDNWNRANSFNVPIDDMMKCIDNALNNGFSLAISVDVTEKGFSLKNGLMIVPEKDYEDISPKEWDSLFSNPHKQKTITQELRQEAFEDFSTADDHTMLITGMVKDQNNDKYYIIKNSWGERDNPFRKGYLYASEAYIKYKTLSILLHKDGLTKEIKNKLK